MTNFEEYPDDWKNSLADQVFWLMRSLPESDKIQIFSKVLSAWHGRGIHEAGPYWWYRESVNFIVRKGNISYIKVLDGLRDPIILKGSSAQIYEDVQSILTHPEIVVGHIQDS